MENRFYPFWIGLGYYACIRIATDSITKVRFWERPWSTTLAELIGTLAISYLVVFGINRIIRSFDKKTFDSPGQQLRYELFRVWLFTTILFNIFANLLTALTDDGLNVHDVVINNLLGSLITILLYLYFRANGFLEAFANEKVKSEQLQREKIETELKYLKNQINPHFLFNALNGIYFQIKESPNIAQETLDRFSKMLRYQLYECSGERVALKKEINYIKDYIEIERMRKTEALILDVDFSSGFNGYEMAPFLLQPLVENAFKHLSGTPEIRIKGHLEAHKFIFQVQNSIDPNLISKTMKVEGGIGLANVKRRLILLYPDAHELEIRQDANFFEVTLNLDLR